jgi:hypothetical protein
MLWAVSSLFTIPFLILVALSAKDPAMFQPAMALMQVANFVAGVFVGPFVLIATSVYYYDLRVRKEAFDLQLMMHPDGQIPSGETIVPSMFA